MCATTSILVLMLDWILHGFPDTDTFILLRIFGKHNLHDPSVAGVVGVIAFILLPFAWAMWFSGRKVAKLYLKRRERTERYGRDVTGGEGTELS